MQNLINLLIILLILINLFNLFIHSYPLIFHIKMKLFFAVS